MSKLSQTFDNVHVRRKQDKKHRVKGYISEAKVHFDKVSNLKIWDYVVSEEDKVTSKPLDYFGCAIVDIDDSAMLGVVPNRHRRNAVVLTCVLLRNTTKVAYPTAILSMVDTPVVI